MAQSYRMLNIYKTVLFSTKVGTAVIPSCCFMIHKEEEILPNQNFACIHFFLTPNGSCSLHAVPSSFVCLHRFPPPHWVCVQTLFFETISTSLLHIVHVVFICCLFLNVMHFVRKTCPWTWTVYLRKTVTTLNSINPPGQ